MKENIGLIGIGLVGTALAENLLAADFSVIGFDLDDEKGGNLERLGGTAAASVQAVGRQAKRIILSLPDSNAVERVVEGPGGLLEIESPLRYIIDTTTGEPERTGALSRRLQGRGIHLLDATLSGSSEQIRRKQGVFMIGGEKEAYEACRDLFLTLAEKHFYLGGSGSGARAKLASNLILGLNRLVLAEGLVFAEKMGLNLVAFLEMVKATPAYSCAMDAKGRKMLEEDFSPQARITQHHKDVRIILDYAIHAGQELPLTKIHKKILDQAIAAGDGEMDNSAVIRQIRRMKMPRNGE